MKRGLKREKTVYKEKGNGKGIQKEENVVYVKNYDRKEEKERNFR